MYFVTWIDNHGICAADSLAQNATKIQFASKEMRRRRRTLWLRRNDSKPATDYFF